MFEQSQQHVQTRTPSSSSLLSTVRCLGLEMRYVKSILSPSHAVRKLTQCRTSAAIVCSHRLRSGNLPDSMLFIDVSFTDDRKCSVTELPEYSSFRWGKKERYRE